jgi:hypothetical protein
MNTGEKGLFVTASRMLKTKRSHRKTLAEVREATLADVKRLMRKPRRTTPVKRQLLASAALACLADSLGEMSV